MPRRAVEQPGLRIVLCMSGWHFQSQCGITLPELSRRHGKCRNRRNILYGVRRGNVFDGRRHILFKLCSRHFFIFNLLCLVLAVFGRHICFGGQIHILCKLCSWQQ